MGKIWIFVNIFLILRIDLHFHDVADEVVDECLIVNVQGESVIFILEDFLELDEVLQVFL